MATLTAASTLTNHATRERGLQLGFRVVLFSLGCSLRPAKTTGQNVCRQAAHEPHKIVFVQSPLATDRALRQNYEHHLSLAVLHRLAHVQACMP